MNDDLVKLFGVFFVFGAWWLIAKVLDIYLRKAQEK